MQISWHLRTRIRFFLIAAALGIAAGVFVLFPLNEFVYFKEYQPPGWSSGAQFATWQIRDALRGYKPKKTAFYAVAGMLLSMSAAAVYSSLSARAEKSLS